MKNIDIWSGLGGAIIGALITVAITGWLDWRKEVQDVNVRETILEVKREFLDDLKANIREAQRAVTTVQIVQDRALKNAEAIDVRRRQVENIVAQLGEQTVEPSAVAEILKPDIVTLIKEEVVPLVKGEIVNEYDLKDRLRYLDELRDKRVADDWQTVVKNGDNLRFQIHSGYVSMNGNYIISKKSVKENPGNNEEFRIWKKGQEPNRE